MTKPPQRGGWSGGPIRPDSSTRLALIALAIGLAAVGLFLMVAS